MISFLFMFIFPAKLKSDAWFIKGTTENKLLIGICMFILWLFVFAFFVFLFVCL